MVNDVMVWHEHVRALSAAKVVFASPASSGDYDTVVGAYLSALSILIVYHMFALQTWLESVGRASDDATTVESKSAPGDLERSDAGARLSGVERDFPLVQLLVVGVAVAVVGALALYAATKSSLAFIFWGTPPIALLLVFVASTAATWFRGRKILRGARRLLGL